MTREEAITIIDNLHLIGCGRNQHENDLKINIALDMAIEALKAEAEWIPCSERLPSEERHYLCCNEGYLPFTAHYHDGQWRCFDGITHVDAWMPLPKPYREDGE